MSKCEEVEIECPDCKEKQTATVWEIINTRLSPEAKQLLFEGKINIFHCPKCGKEFLLPVSLLYHDQEKQMTVYYYPPAWINDETFISEFKIDKGGRVINKSADEAWSDFPQELQETSSYFRVPHIVFDFNDFLSYIKFRDKIIEKDNTNSPDSSEREEVRILMSANDPATRKLLTEFLHERIGQKCILLITEIPFANELLHHAQKNHVDIFIFVLDNILFTADTGYSSDNRVKEMLDFVSFIKRKYKKPVIAIEGWPNDPAFGEEAKSAGADFFFRLPFEGQEFQQAVEWCILDSLNRQKKYIY